MAIEQVAGEAEWSLDFEFLTIWRERIRAVVRKLKQSKLSSRLDTSDLVQEGMLQAYQQLDSFRGTTEQEFDAWAKMGNERFDGVVKPLADQFDFIGDGDAIISGITAMAAFGHTPGHMIYRIESEGKQLVITADTANHYVWSLAYPDWEVKFDMDKAAAAAARREVFGMLAADRIPFLGYHMPFPGVGFVEAMDNNFRYVPVSYQLAL